jgi:hypothetical protein
MPIAPFQVELLGELGDVAASRSTSAPRRPRARLRRGRAGRR